MYNITGTHIRDIFGSFLWAEPLREDERLYRPGEEFIIDGIKYRVERVALIENTQHVNVAVVEEDLNIVRPFL